MANTLTVRTPDDMHAHLRDGNMLRAVLPDTARHFARAIVMPNLSPAVRTVAEASAYRDRILVALAGRWEFNPLMTLYLTEDTPVEEVLKAAESPFVHAFKNYPKGATTNSAEGVRDLRNVTKQLEAMQQTGIPLLLHGEVTLDENGEEVDHFDRERIFVEHTLTWLQEEFPDLRVVLEHITTEEAADYLMEHGGRTLAATVTPHHLVVDRRALFYGGLNPHLYCLPILKRSEDRDALRALVATKNDFVFAGTDTAPHPSNTKERACACTAGCYVAPVALSMYAQVFEEENALPLLEAFLSENGANWYGLPLNEGEITLVRSDEPKAPTELLFVEGIAPVRPFGMHDDPTKSMKWHWQVQQ